MAACSGCSGGCRCRCCVEQFGQVNVEVLSPPASSALVSVIFNEFKRSEFFQMVIQIVPVNTQPFLELNGAHFF